MIFSSKKHDKVLDACIVCIEEHRLDNEEEDCFWCQPIGDESYKERINTLKSSKYAISKREEREINIYNDLILTQKRITARHNCSCDKCKNTINN